MQVLVQTCSMIVHSSISLVPFTSVCSIHIVVRAIQRYVVTRNLMNRPIGMLRISVCLNYHTVKYSVLSYVYSLLLLLRNCVNRYLILITRYPFPLMFEYNPFGWNFRFHDAVCAAFEFGALGRKMADSKVQSHRNIWKQHRAECTIDTIRRGFWYALRRTKVNPHYAIFFNKILLQVTIIRNAPRNSSFW